jgi:hypothetical protein
LAFLQVLKNFCHFPLTIFPMHFEGAIIIEQILDLETWRFLLQPLYDLFDHTSGHHHELPAGGIAGDLRKTVISIIEHIRQKNTATVDATNLNLAPCILLSNTQSYIQRMTYKTSNNYLFNRTQYASESLAVCENMQAQKTLLMGKETNSRILRAEM